MNKMKLNLLSVILAGSFLFLTACGGDDKSDSPSTSPNVNVDVNKIQNPVVNTPQPYMPNSPKNRPENAAESVVMTYKMQGIKGAVALAPANNLKLIEELSEMALMNMEDGTFAKTFGYIVLDTLTSYMAAGMKSLYPTEPVYSKIFKSPIDKTAEQAEKLCLVPLGFQFLGEVGAYMSKNEGRLKGYSSRKQEGFKNDPIVKQFLEKDSQPLQSLIKTPIIIYQGGSDNVVIPQATDALVAQARALTTKIDYRTDPTWDHFSIYAANVANGQLLTDIKTLLAN